MMIIKKTIVRLTIVVSASAHRIRYFLKISLHLSLAGNGTDNARSYNSRCGVRSARVRERLAVYFIGTNGTTVIYFVRVSGYKICVHSAARVHR